MQLSFSDMFHSWKKGILKGKEDEISYLAHRLKRAPSFKRDAIVEEIIDIRRVIKTISKLTYSYIVFKGSGENERVLYTEDIDPVKEIGRIRYKKKVYYIDHSTIYTKFFVARTFEDMIESKVVTYRAETDV